MFCNKCGDKLTIDSLFCSKCGTKVVNPENVVNKEAQSKKNGSEKVLEVKSIIFKKCPNCNEEIKHGGEKCRNCGAIIINKNQDNNSVNTNILAPKNIETGKKEIPWHQSFMWWHILILSFVSLLIYFWTYWAIFDWIFLIGLIYSIVVLVKSRKKKK